MISMRSGIKTLTITAATMVLAAGPALAHTCTNASKQPDAGVQVVFDAFTGEIVWTTNGVAQRIANGVIDPTTGEGFHGLIGFDLDGDAVADVSIWEGVGPDGQIPVVAQDAGPECQGVMNIDEFIAACADLDV